MSKFIKYFLLVFVVSFALLNFRLLWAEGKYQLNRTRSDLESVKRSDLVLTSSQILPISDSRYFTLEIPSLGVKAPIILEKSTDPQKIFQRLAEGVVHYEDTPLPGEKGTSIILGHSSAYPWYKGQYGSIFALLGKLKEGDTFLVANGDKTFRYRVTGTVVFNPFNKNDEQVQAIEQTDTSSILLVSCWPIGTNYKRIAVKGDLVSD